MIKCETYLQGNAARLLPSQECARTSHTSLLLLVSGLHILAKHLQLQILRGAQSRLKLYEMQQ